MAHFIKFVPLPDLGIGQLKWTAKFYNPKHSAGNRDRLDRLEAQARIVMQIATSLSLCLQYRAKNACLRSNEVRANLKRNTGILLRTYKRKGDEDEIRIGLLFMAKRHLLHIIHFILSNEPEVAARYKMSLKELTDSVEEDTCEWMEIIDYLETLKNPNYLEMKWNVCSFYSLSFCDKPKVERKNINIYLIKSVYFVYLLASYPGRKWNKKPWINKTVFKNM